MNTESMYNYIFLLTLSSMSLWIQSTAGLGSLWLGRRWPLYRTHSVREGMESFFLSYSPSRDSFIHFLVWSLPAPTITITSENLKVFIQSQANSEFGLSTGNQGALVNGQYRMASKAFSLVQTSRDNPPSHWPPTSLWMPHCLIYHKDGRCW